MSGTTDSAGCQPRDRAERCWGRARSCGSSGCLSQPDHPQWTPFRRPASLRLEVSASSSLLTTGPRSEIVQRVQHFAGLPHPVAGEAGELLKDAGVHQWGDGAQRILRGDAEFTRHRRCIDDRLPDQHVDQPPRRRVGVRPLSLLRVMLPMIAELGELSRVRERMKAIALELGIGELPQLGVMIEVP